VSDEYVPELGDIAMMSDGEYAAWNGREWQDSGEVIAKVNDGLARVFINPMRWPPPASAESQRRTLACVSLFYAQPHRRNHD